MLLALQNLVNLRGSTATYSLVALGGVYTLTGQAATITAPTSATLPIVEVNLRPRQRRQIIVAHNGKDYVVELDELPEFLAQIEEETPSVVVKRAATKRTKKPAPVVKLVEAPEDSKSLILEQLSATNRLIRTEWASAVQNYLAYKAAVELAQDEEDIELLLMAA